MTFTRTVALPVTPDEAFALVTQPERLRRWLAVSAYVDLRAGGDYRWTITPGHYAAGTVREVEPGRRVVLGWGSEVDPDLPTDSTTVTITIEPTHGGCTLTLRHEGLDPGQEARHAEGWQHFLGRLEVAAARGDAGQDEWTLAPAHLDSVIAAEATLAVLQPVLRGLTCEHRSAATPCAGYTCDDLAEHLIGTITGLGAMAGADVTDPGGDSLEHRIATVAAQAVTAWRGVDLAGTVPGPRGDLPAAFAGDILSIEFLIHAWDFAQASGQDIRPSDEVVAYVDAATRRVAAEGRDRIFDPEVPAPADATPLDRLVAYSGRSPLGRGMVSQAAAGTPVS